MQKVPQHKLLANTKIVNDKPNKNFWNWGEEQNLVHIEMGNEQYNLDLSIELYTKLEDDFEEQYNSRQVISDFSSASEETKQILRN